MTASVFRRQHRQIPVKQGFVPTDELALKSAYRRLSERIERRAAQKARGRERAQGRRKPPAQAQLCP